MLFQKIEKPHQGRRFVISDIHGCAQTFQKLVKDEIQLTKNDQLFLLGDYIDRGPDSAGVLDFILEMQNADYQIFALRGNHEESLLESYQNYLTDMDSNYKEFREEIIKRDLQNLFDEDDYLKYSNFLNKLFYYFETEDFYIVHAGFNFKLENPFNDLWGMISIRRFKNDEVFTQGKTIVHGHTVTRLSTIKEKIESKSNIIPLDNGCYYGMIGSVETCEDKYGYLCALNLDSFELIMQVCID